MATFDQIKEVRLSIDDPAGFIDMLSVSSLPDVGDALPQRAYYSTEDQGYHAVRDGAFALLHLRLADSRISAWIDSEGLAGAIQKGYVAIMQKLGNEMQIVKNSDGAESTEFVKLLDLYEFYKSLAKDTAAQPPANSGGRLLRTVAPEIAGGNL